MTIEKNTVFTKELIVMDLHEWRIHKRKQHKGTIDIMVNVVKENKIEKISYNAETVDISRGGIGVVTDTPIEPGFVRFKDGNEQKSGIVMWNRKLDNNKYRVGIQFDQPLINGNGFEDIGPQNA